MERYDLTQDGYRREFRASKPETDESPEQFLVRLDRYLLRWLELSDTEQTFGGLKDLIVKEQCIDSCPKDLAIHLRERAPETLAKIAKIADQYWRLMINICSAQRAENQQFSLRGTKPRTCRAIKQLSVALTATPEVIKLLTAQS